MEMQPSRVKPENKIELEQQKNTLSGMKRKKIGEKGDLEETKKIAPKLTKKRQKQLEVSHKPKKPGTVDSGFRSTMVGSPMNFSPSEDRDKYPSSPSQDDVNHLKRPRMDEEDHHGLSYFPAPSKQRERLMTFAIQANYHNESSDSEEGDSKPVKRVNNLSLANKKNGSAKSKKPHAIGNYRVSNFNNL